MNDGHDTFSCSLDHWPLVLTCIFNVCTYLISNWFLNVVDRLRGLKSFHYTTFQLSTCQPSHNLSWALAMYCELFGANDVKRI